MSTKENGAATTGAAFDMWPMMRLCGAAVPALSGFNGALYQSLAAMNTAWLEFANRRLKETLALPEHIAGCTTVPRLLWVYNSYCRTAVEDYQAAVAEIQRRMFDVDAVDHHARQRFAGRRFSGRRLRSRGGFGLREVIPVGAAGSVLGQIHRETVDDNGVDVHALGQ